MVKVAEDAKAAKEARDAVSELLLDYWTDLTGSDYVDTSSFNIVLSYVEDFGFATVCNWIGKAVGKCGPRNDKNIGKYVSGIRRCVMAQQEGGE